MVSDQQQTVTIGDVEETAERWVNQKVKLAVNDEGNISVYLSRLEQEADRIRGEVEDYAQGLGSSILQTASQIRSEVHAAESRLYSVVEQSASGVITRVNESSNIYTGKTAPIGTSTKPIKEGDMWIDTNFQRNWSDVDDLIAWVDDANYDWSETQGSKVRYYDGNEWREVLDETALMTNTDFQILADGVHQVSRSIETLDNGLNAYIGRLEVTSKNMQLDYTDRYRQLNSAISVTASQLRTEFNDTANGLSSSITQTASQIRTELRNTTSGLSSSITQTASQIRAEVNAANSTIYSSITQTASQIRAEVRNTESGLRSTITQTASQIRSEVASTSSSIRSSITQTASQIRSEIANTSSSIRSSITQQADRISLVVQGTGSNAKIKPASIVAAINEGASSVVISADHINLNGYVKATDITADFISAKIAAISRVNMQTMHANYVYADTNLYLPNGLSVYATGVRTVSLSGPTNNVYTLKQTTFNGTETTIGTFSRATTLSGAWSGSTYTVTASPQGNTQSATIYMYASGNGATNFTVGASHTSASSTRSVASQYIYLTQSVSAKKVYARWGSNTGTAYGSIDISDTYNDGEVNGYSDGYDAGYSDGARDASSSYTYWGTGLLYRYNPEHNSYDSQGTHTWYYK